MLRITVPSVEGFNEDKNEFVDFIPETKLQLEHSLLSLSKWESKWKKPFLSRLDDQITNEELIDYIRCMTLNSNINPEIYNYIPNSIITEIINYINDPMTATTFNIEQKGGGKKIITSEIIYYWMISMNIPFECQKWHLNKLLTLIRVCNEKNAPQKKMSTKDIMSRNRALNAQRKAKLHSRG